MHNITSSYFSEISTNRSICCRSYIAHGQKHNKINIIIFLNKTFWKVKLSISNECCSWLIECCPSNSQWPWTKAYDQARLLSRRRLSLSRSSRIRRCRRLSSSGETDGLPFAFVIAFLKMTTIATSAVTPRVKRIEHDMRCIYCWMARSLNIFTKTDTKQVVAYTCKANTY